MSNTENETTSTPERLLAERVETMIEADIEAWEAAGYPIGEINSWLDAGFSLTEAKAWREAGYGVGAAVRYSDKGLRPA